MDLVRNFKRPGNASDVVPKNIRSPSSNFARSYPNRIETITCPRSPQMEEPVTMQVWEYVTNKPVMVFLSSYRQILVSRRSDSL